MIHQRAVSSRLPAGGVTNRTNQTTRSLARDLLALVAYIPLTLGFFWQFAFLPGVYMPRGGGDLASFLYPVYSFAARSIQSGHFPLWNPYSYGGSPFVADMQSGVHYPINLLAFWLVRPLTYETLQWLAVSHFVLAAAFTYLYLRGLGLVRPAAFGGGLIFAFSGFTVAHLGHLNMLAAAVWLPLIALFFHRALTRPSIASAVAAGLAYGVSILAGHVQISLMIGLFLGCYWLWGVFTREHLDDQVTADSSPPGNKSLHTPARTRPDATAPVVEEGSHSGALHSRGSAAARQVREAAPSRESAVGSRWSRLLVMPVTILVGLGVAAWQLIPAAELTALSLRSEITYARAAEFSASPLGFVTFLVPHFFGRDNLAYWGLKGSLAEVYGYVGIVTLLLATVAVVLPRRRLSWRWFFLAMAGLFLLLSIGEHTPLHGWLYRFVPGFDKVRAPGRFVLLVDFALAVLAAGGLHALTLRTGWRDRPYLRRVVLVLGALACLTLPVAAYFYRALLTSQDKDPVIFQRVQLATTSLSLTIFFLVVGIALLWSWSRASGLRASRLAWFAVALIALDLFAAGSRFNPTDENVIAGFEHPEVVSFLRSDPGPYRVDSVTGVWDVWQPNTTLLHGIPDVMGIYNPMTLADWDRYWNNLGSRSGRAYDLLNAKYVVAHKDVQLDWSKFKPVLTDAPRVNVYENANVLPRALLVPRAEALARDEILERVRRSDFVPEDNLFLEAPVAVMNVAPADWQHDILAVETPSPNEVIIRARTSAPGYLLVNDIYYPGWQVRVNGQDEEIKRANYTFRAVALPAGEHVVHFAFAPRFWIPGLVISAMTWAFSLALGVAMIFKSRGLFYPKVLWLR
jgi:hypothetical protein